MNEIIKLVSETFVVNEFGDKVVNTSEKTVFATLKSVRQSEFYQAQAVGLKPEIVFVLSDYLDYNSEEIVLYKPYQSDEWIRYKVLRTYRDNNALEIVCHRGIDQ